MGNSRRSGMTPLTSRLLSISVGTDEGRVNAPVQVLRTSDGVAAPEAARLTGQARHFPLLRVIATASPFWLVAAGTTTALALVATIHDRVPFGSGLAVALLTFAAIVDVHERRLPDSLVIAAAVAFAICVGIETAAGATDVSLVDIAGGVAAFGGPLLILHLVAPASMGFGDVKAGLVLGAAIGVVDWQLALAGLALAAGLTATVGVLTRASTIAFGPGLVAAGAIVLVAHPMILATTDRVGDTRPNTTAALALEHGYRGDPQ
jgi:leader peptidase (prepilin peptidase)/N-methyltransferase